MRLLLDAYRIKWICIMLNEFLPLDAARRAFADQGARAIRCREQLDKAAPRSLPSRQAEPSTEDHARHGPTEFVSLVHKSTTRDYLARVTERDKAEVAELALQWDYDYWDGSRQTGYGGYKYDGRWRKVADAMVAAYGIEPGMRVLDVGAGKGFLLHDFTEAVPGIEVAGIDVSKYGIEHAMPSVKDRIVHGSAEKLPFPDKHFDLVISINALHNLYNYDLWSAFRGDRAGRARCEIHLRRGLPQRAREGEFALLAAHLPRLPYPGGMGVRLQADRLPRRPRVHLFRVAPNFASSDFASRGVGSRGVGWRTRAKPARSILVTVMSDCRRHPIGALACGRPLRKTGAQTTPHR